MVLVERDAVGGNARIKETAGRGFDGGFDGEGDQVVLYSSGSVRWVVKPEAIGERAYSRDFAESTGR